MPTSITTMQTVEPNLEISTISTTDHITTMQTVEPTQEISTVTTTDHNDCVPIRDITLTKTVNRTPESVRVIVVSSPLREPTKDTSISPILGATITDVLLTALPTNSVSVRKSTSTRIKEIKGVEIKDITITHLRLFAKNIGLKNFRKQNKHDICINILQCIESGGNDQTVSSATNLDESSLITGSESNRSIINRRRFINVLFSDVCRPKLALRGQPLNKDDLTAGIKTDQRLHELVSTEYNKRNIISYGKNAFPNIKKDATVTLQNLTLLRGKKVRNHSQHYAVSTTGVFLIGRNQDTTEIFLTSQKLFLVL